MKKNERINTLIRPAITAMGYELLGCEMIVNGKHSVLRVYIDNSADTEGKVNVDDCVAVSRQINAVLDVEDAVSGRYSLEVSSPGIDRPLFEKEHFEKYVGHQLKIMMSIPFENRRKFIGELLKVNDNEGATEILIKADDEEFILPLNTIKKANLIESEQI